MKKWIVFFLIFGWVVFAQAEILWQEDFEFPMNETAQFGAFTDYAPEAHTPGSQTDEDLCSDCGNYVWKYARSANSGYQDRTGWALGATGNYQLDNVLHYRMYVKFSSTAAFQCGSSGCEWGIEYKFPDFKTEAGDRPILKWRSGGQVTLYSSATGVDVPESNEPHVQAGKWYVVEFMMLDNGSNDIGRVWVASEDDNFQYTEGNPSAEETGNIWTNSAGWDGSAAWWAWYFANHDTPQPVDIYIDNFAIGNSFIGPADGSGPPPPPPPPPVEVEFPNRVVWQAVPADQEITGYWVYRDGIRIATEAAAILELDISGFAYTVDQQYCFSVRSIRGAEEGPMSVPVCAIAEAVTPPLPDLTPVTGVELTD